MVGCRWPPRMPAISTKHRRIFFHFIFILFVLLAKPATHRWCVSAGLGQRQVVVLQEA